MAAAPRFVATVRDVVEVALAADADLAYWRARLEPAGLVPVERAGRAELTLSATRLAWLGTRTREFTLGVTVRPAEAPAAPESQLLLQAFNSSRGFAWIERAFFQTPYALAAIEVWSADGPGFELAGPAGPRLHARLAPTTAPARTLDITWQGQIFLPPDRALSARAAAYFVAHLGGRTEVYPAPAAALTLTPDPAFPVFQWLKDSGLAGREWRVQRQAVHARTATFPRR